MLCLYFLDDHFPTLTGPVVRCVVTLFGGIGLFDPQTGGTAAERPQAAA